MNYAGSSKEVDWEKYQRRFDQEFEKSGTKEKIVQETRERLNNSKWADEVQHKFDEYVKSKGIKPSELNEKHMEEICNEMKDELRRIIPNDIKRDLLESITDFIDDQMLEVKKEVLS
ncbi:unnamed protein product [Bursaphelenchus okinawaensis]|uniref:Transcription and mRNA export factor ENY2 n=1 Tax=Bursaphelenchus okinawaensis TaxID=465554 RepID=A0A811JSQ7_9BILA|nr:unnamed protein product [Bursaphelenchus okinawaensis]CAG9080797.1 unnamed protein product [Bursaphelenchus okinawaensis]